MLTKNLVKDTYVNNRQKRAYQIVSLCIAFGLSLRPIPWAIDDLNYLDYVMYSNVLLTNTLIKTLENPLFILTNEPLWLLINKYLYLLFTPEMSLRIIIFLSTITVLIALGRVTNYSFLMILFFFILVPIIKNHILHLRQGLALGMYLLGLTMKNKRGIFLRLLTPFIHTSFWIVIFIELFERIAKPRLSLNARLLLFSIATFIFALSMSSLIKVVGDRRSELYASNESGSYYGLLLWICIGIIFLLLVKKDKYGVIARYAIIFYIITYIFVDYGARIFENFIPIIVASALVSKLETKFVFVLLFLVYGGLSWYLWGGFNN